MQALLSFATKIAFVSVVAILLYGLWGMARGGRGNLSQKLMRWRVGAQFAAIVIAMACLALRHPPG